jgi:hypothetical protein
VRAFSKQLLAVNQLKVHYSNSALDFAFVHQNHLVALNFENASCEVLNLATAKLRVFDAKDQELASAIRDLQAGFEQRESTGGSGEDNQANPNFNQIYKAWFKQLSPCKKLLMINFRNQRIGAFDLDLILKEDTPENIVSTFDLSFSKGDKISDLQFVQNPKNFETYFEYSCFVFLTNSVKAFSGFKMQKSNSNLIVG